LIKIKKNRFLLITLILEKKNFIDESADAFSSSAYSIASLCKRCIINPNLDNSSKQLRYSN
jgi:hypothetical protein